MHSKSSHLLGLPGQTRHVSQFVFAEWVHHVRSGRVGVKLTPLLRRHRLDQTRIKPDLLFRADGDPREVRVCGIQQVVPFGWNDHARQP